MWQYDLSDMILRIAIIRPSFYEYGNEVQEAWIDNVGIERAAMLQEFVHQLGPSRKCAWRLKTIITQVLGRGGCTG